MNDAFFAHAASVLVLSLASSACGGVDVATGGASSTGSVGTTTGSSSTTTSTSTSSSTTVSSGTGAQLYSTPTLSDIQFTLDCQPVVGADPINGQFTALYVNPNGAPQTLDLKGAKLKLAQGGNTLDWTFGVTPSSSGSIPGMQGMNVVHTKVAGSGVGTPANGTPCSFCGGTWSLEVTWGAGFADEVATAGAGTILCAL